MSARLLDEAEHHAEAEAGALVPALGREEWFENPMHDLRGHAGPGIADFEHDVAARYDLGVLCGIIGVECDCPLRSSDARHRPWRRGHWWPDWSGSPRAGPGRRRPATVPARGRARFRRPRRWFGGAGA